MFAIPGLSFLVLFDYFKPQEYVPLLADLPLLYVFTGLTLVGFVVDLRLGLSRFAAAPQLGLATLFVGWSVLTNVGNGAAVFLRQAFSLLIPFSLYLLLAHVVQTFRMLRWIVAVVLAIGLTLGFVGTHQGFARWGCHRLDYEGGKTVAVYDGRLCSEEDKQICRQGADPGVDYICEHVGLLGTQSVAGRVRFRGTIQDPNELSLAVGIVIPLAFAFFERRRGALGLLLLLVTIGLAGACLIFTKSRGGQVVVLVALGVYFVRRFGARGVVAGLVCAVPILLLGGRTTDEAAGSTMERVECWARGMELWRASPVLGVGLGQFTEHHYLTAHNSFVLTAAELGSPGMVLWTATIYVSMKIAIQALRRGGVDEEAPLAREALPWSLAIFSGLAGMTAGMIFLSFAYKEGLWIWIGLSGALYQAIRRHDPSFRVRFGWRDLGLVVALDAFLIAATTMYTKLKLG